MQQSVLLHNILKDAGAIKHSGRLKSVLNGVESVMSGANLALTSLGRHLNKSIKPKSKIKEIDYLLSNGQLLGERLGIYRAVNDWVVGQEKVLFIVMDWSTLVAHQLHLLRASIIRKGRCLTVYEEIHTEKELGTGEVHQSFLKS